MSWSTFIFDTMTGQRNLEIDLPKFSWDMTVSDSSLATVKDKGTGSEGGSGISVPWSALPISAASARDKLLASYRKSMVILWNGKPVVAGLIGCRTDTYLDTSFSLLSPWDLLGNRIMIHEGAFGTADGSTTRTDYTFSNLSLRAIGSQIVQACTNSKSGGTLPVDYPYLDETGTHERTYYGYDVSNTSGKNLLTNLSNVEDGPDFQFRPYMLDENHLRYSFLGGDPYLKNDDLIPTVSCYAGGGTLQNVEVTWLGPTQRVYSTGSGSDYAMLCHLSENLTLCNREEPWPLIESVLADSSDSTTAALTEEYGDAYLSANLYPVCQIKGDLDLTTSTVQPGIFWPGQNVYLQLNDYPTLPDGTYTLRVMEMSGDESSKATVIFDPIISPWEGDVSS